MPLPLDIELAKQRMLEAGAALRSYVDSDLHDRDLHRQLVEALNEAMTDFVEKVSRLETR
jgi:hypothetical protein